MGFHANYVHYYLFMHSFCVFIYPNFQMHFHDFNIHPFFFLGFVQKSSMSMNMEM